MFIVNFLISIAPVVLAFLIVFLIYHIITSKLNHSKINTKTFIPVVVISISLIIYYLPNKNIIKEYDFDYIYIDVKDESIEVKDIAQINKIVETINIYTFTKSAFRSITQEVYDGDYFISIRGYDYKNGFSLQLNVQSDLLKDTAPPWAAHVSNENRLKIEEQVYNCTENKSLSDDIYYLAKEFGLLEK